MMQLRLSSSIASLFIVAIATTISFIHHSHTGNNIVSVVAFTAISLPSSRSSSFIHNSVNTRSRFSQRQPGVYGGDGGGRGGKGKNDVFLHLNPSISSRRIRNYILWSSNSNGSGGGCAATEPWVSTVAPTEQQNNNNGQYLNGYNNNHKHDVNGNVNRNVNVDVNGYNNNMNHQNQIMQPMQSTTTSSTNMNGDDQQQQQQQQQQQSPTPPLPLIDTFTLPLSAAPTLDGRLLCASQCAYEINPPYFKAAAFRPITTAKRLTKGVNSVLIGHTYDGICIAFRGTQSSSPLDWLQNAALFLSDVEDGQKKPVTGKVHTGFYRGTKSLWKPLKKILREMLEECYVNGWKQDIILTGHSKGGAMASVAALLMKRDKELPDPTYVCTFASAKVGDSEFCSEYNKHINQTSYEAHLDLIPFLPPSSTTMDMMDDSMKDMLDSMLWSDTSIQKKENYKWDYQTVGTRKYITKDYEIISDVTKELDEERIRDIEQNTFLALDDFKAAHCSSCPEEGCNGYYFNAIAGSVCNEDNCNVNEERCVDDIQSSNEANGEQTTSTSAP